jgi:hypothetical protein
MLIKKCKKSPFNKKKMRRKNRHKHLHQLYRVLGLIKSDRLGKVRNKTKRRRVKLALGQV